MSIKKKTLYNPILLSGLGEAKLMLNIKNKNINKQQFGGLELVDRELFFICANRRDT